MERCFGGRDEGEGESLPAGESSEGGIGAACSGSPEVAAAHFAGVHPVRVTGCSPTFAEGNAAAASSGEEGRGFELFAVGCHALAAGGWGGRGQWRCCYWS